MGLLKSKKKIIIAIIVLAIIIMLIILLSPNGAIYKAISNRYKETEQEMDAKINFTSEVTSRVTATSAKVNVNITSDIDIDRVIFENDDGTLTEEIVNGKTLTKEITVTADKKYVVSIVTTDGKVTRENILKTKDMIPVKIEATNFGDYIDYPIDLNGNGKTTDDWMIFYVADGNAEGEQAGGAYEDNIGDVYIIAADYLKNTDSRLKLNQMGTITNYIFHMEIANIIAAMEIGWPLLLHIMLTTWDMYAATEVLTTTFMVSPVMTTMVCAYVL